MNTYINQHFFILAFHHQRSLLIKRKFHTRHNISENYIPINVKKIKKIYEVKGSEGRCKDLGRWRKRGFPKEKGAVEPEEGGKRLRNPPDHHPPETDVCERERSFPSFGPILGANLPIWTKEVKLISEICD